MCGLSAQQYKSLFFISNSHVITIRTKLERNKCYLSISIDYTYYNKECRKSAYISCCFTIKSNKNYEKFNSPYLSNYDEL